MSLVTIDPDGGEPPYEQVRRQIAAGAATGALAPGHKLPTVRSLAEDLDLATNTVAKAYRALEVDGIVQTLGRRGTFIAARRLEDPDAGASAQAYARSARARGLSLDEAIRLVERHWTDQPK